MGAKTSEAGLLLEIDSRITPRDVSGVAEACKRTKLSADDMEGLINMVKKGDLGVLMIEEVESIWLCLQWDHGRADSGWEDYVCQIKAQRALPCSLDIRPSESNSKLAQ